MESELVNILTVNRSSPDANQRAITCIRKLQSELEKVGPQWLVRAFGSFANGLCVKGSDLDATCYSSNSDEEVSARTTLDLLNRLKDLLESHPDFHVVEFVTNARVPILKLRFDAVLDVDLSCNNSEPFPNTQLLRAYTSLSPVIRDVLLLIKLWAKGAGVVGAKDGNLSSYSFALMVVYFMQVDRRVNLPCFQTADFTGEIEVPLSARFTWSPSLSRAALLHMFFNFYAFSFQWNSEVVAMHLGQRTDQHAPIHANLKDIWESRLHIADPFLAHRNLNCVLRSDNEVMLYRQIQTAASEMQAGVLPSALRSYVQQTQWLSQQSIPAQMPQFMSSYPENYQPPMREPSFARSYANGSPISPNFSYARDAMPPPQGAPRQNKVAAFAKHAAPLPTHPSSNQNDSMHSNNLDQSRAAPVNVRGDDNEGSSNSAWRKMMRPEIHEIPFTRLATSH
eukprot:TRINITY_DN21177_c0_g2_i1.p1 TRINITY_DN21177_c0_g2~~TRINITY_DN21177_c0_g2_i1.p1  ORF type:complete len:452 (-),score=66.88 TRINITY_DN21177_c0_g2_i1:486-1841(-)